MFVLTIDNFDNESMQTSRDSEVARILRKVADKIEVGRIDDADGKLMDYNGNCVGRCEVDMSCVLSLFDDDADDDADDAPCITDNFDRNARW